MHPHDGEGHVLLQDLEAPVGGSRGVGGGGEQAGRAEDKHSGNVRKTHEAPLTGESVVISERSRNAVYPTTESD
ncbi:hypothetical protein GCM10018965_073830 [Nonomuraea roseola]